MSFSITNKKKLKKPRRTLSSLLIKYPTMEDYSKSRKNAAIHSQNLLIYLLNKIAHCNTTHERLRLADEIQYNLN